MAIIHSYSPDPDYHDVGIEDYSPLGAGKSSPYANLKAVFDDIAKDLKIDRALLKRLQAYETEFTHRNNDHIAFFSGNLLGVDKVRFKTTDWANWFDDIIQLDDTELRQAVHALPSVNKDFVVSSDVMNISCMWLIHAFENSDLSPKEKHDGMMAAALVFHYKVLSSKLAHDFPFAANKEIAITVYAQLTKKFALKQHGSWGALLRARCEDLIRKGTLHWKTIENFGPDAAVLYMVTDTQGRIRDVVKKLWEVLDKVRASDSKIVTVSSTITVDGEAKVGDLNRHLVDYKHYIHGIVGTPTTFIKEELIDVVGNAMHTMNPEFLQEALVWISTNYHDSLHEDKVHELVEETMLHAFGVLALDDHHYKRSFDLVFIIDRLRGVYMSSRSTDPYLVKLRAIGDELVRVPLRGRSTSAQISTRTGLLLYIVLRALTRNYYTTH